MPARKLKSSHDQDLRGVVSYSSHRFYSGTVARVLRGSGSSDKVFAKQATDKPKQNTVLIIFFLSVLGLYLADIYGLLPF